ncbi:TctA subunit of the tripartite Tricarboxylate transport(TTT) family protein [Mesorhizobium sp. CGMCC 1.15528]|uniref:TctA subunit of the tripartite Tricarboxylate transport(TTT) family protein n=1 Tax=Mesorhizobium zhangyense TaxID=1776730 RepID=A0A7C9RCQ0_9HYPH|nr:tripartite tricarboxylate transporter permease [Mesorhizobium zhangyense]NGN45297.1 TctA subunit of the tripartite Tricarboxylate transport(TTT) family protein [Mesorhizobium zhangyense]
MEIFSDLFFGLSVATSSPMLLATLLGVLLGLAIGVLPAMGPPAALAILLPIVVSFEPTVAVAGLAGVYYGAMYGGAVTSILLGIPGESAAMMTTLDGYPMAKNGEAGRALGIATFASFVGGFISILLFTAIAAPFAEFALRFGPIEMTALMVMTLIFSTSLGGEDRAKGFAALGLGLWLGTVGLDIVSGSPRFNFGTFELLEGIEFTVIAIGMYGVGEILASVNETAPKVARARYTLRALLPRISDMYKTWKDLIVGSVIGFVVGVLPGAGATAATIFSYSFSKKISRHPENFGKGAPEGIASPESANNSASYAAMIPLFTLGIPGSGTTAIMLGGLLMLGLQPGPLLFEQNPDFIWPVIGTFYTGNLMLVVLTILLTPILASLVFIPAAYLFPIVLGIVVYGVFSVNYSFFDLGMAMGFGLLGYLFRKFSYPSVPVLLGLVLGPILEQNVRRSLIMSNGDIGIFASSTISVVFLLLSASLLLLPMFKWAKARLKKAGV